MYSFGYVVRFITFDERLDEHYIACRYLLGVQLGLARGSDPTIIRAII